MLRKVLFQGAWAFFNSAAKVVRGEREFSLLSFSLEILSFGFWLRHCKCFLSSFFQEGWKMSAPEMEKKMEGAVIPHKAQELPALKQKREEKPVFYESRKGHWEGKYIYPASSKLLEHLDSISTIDTYPSVYVWKRCPHMFWIEQHRILVTMTSRK